MGRVRRSGQPARACEHALDIACDQVDLEIDLAPGGEAAQGRVLDGVRDQVDAEFASVVAVDDAIDRQADAVDGDRALLREEASQRARRGDAQLPRLAGALEPSHGADAVDVAADEVAVEPVAGAQRLLEVDVAGSVEAARRGEALGRDRRPGSDRSRRRSRRRSCRRRRGRCCRRSRCCRANRPAPGRSAHCRTLRRRRAARRRRFGRWR